MCRFCPTVGRNATGLVKILTTRTAKTRAAEPFDSCVHSYAIVALTTSYIRVVYSCDCGQVLFRSSIVVGPVAVGQARRSSEFAVCSRLQTLVDLLYRKRAHWNLLVPELSCMRTTVAAKHGTSQCSSEYGIFFLTYLCFVCIVTPWRRDAALEDAFGSVLVAQYYSGYAMLAETSRQICRSQHVHDASSLGHLSLV
jgi:hypothetical protein